MSSTGLGVGIQFVYVTWFGNCPTSYHYRDTAGQERFKALTAQYYRRAQGILLVYDLTNEQSFENTASWLRMIKEVSELERGIISMQSYI